jgi:hypothetical protein
MTDPMTDRPLTPIDDPDPIIRREVETPIDVPPAPSDPAPPGLPEPPPDPLPDALPA